jgi:transcription-repair coupling factor (superfamily II helicase)
VLQLRGQTLPEIPDPVVINLGLPAHLPDALIPIPGHRLALYKRLSAAETREEVAALLDETADRYGRLPEPAQNLFRAAELRVLAMRYGATQLDWADGAVAIKFGARASIDGERVHRLLESDRTVRLLSNGTLKVLCDENGGDRITLAMRALSRIAEG